MAHKLAVEIRADAQARHHFQLLPHEQQLLAIRRLGALGYAACTVADVTGVAVAQIRRVLTDGDTTQ